MLSQLRWIYGNTVKDRIRNIDVLREVGVVDIEDMLVWACEMPT